MNWVHFTLNKASSYFDRSKFWFSSCTVKPPIMGVAFRSCCLPKPYESLAVTVAISSTPCVQSLPLSGDMCFEVLAEEGFAPLENSWHKDFLASVHFTEFHFSP